MKVATPDHRCIEIDAPSGRRYNFRKGIAEVSQRDAKAIVREGGFIPSMAGTTSRSVGFRCVDCGFGSFFAKCSRCGGEAKRELTDEQVDELLPDRCRCIEGHH